MNDVSTLGDVVDSTTTEVAHAAAAETAALAPDATQTTVVVESEEGDTTATGLDAAAHMKKIAREETEAYIKDLILLDEANRAEEPEPKVVVVQQEAIPAPVPDEPPEPAPKREKPKKDDAPPMARSHRYFKPLGKKGNS